MKIQKKYVGDTILVTLILALCTLLGVILYTSNKSSEKVNVTVDGDIYITLPLDKDTEFSPDNYHTVITVKDGKAYISESDCPDGLCKKMTPVTSKGGSVICLPNRVTITLSGSNTDGGIDYVAG